jgi:hypothetical protein
MVDRQQAQGQLSARSMPSTERSTHDAMCQDLGLLSCVLERRAKHATRHEARKRHDAAAGLARWALACNYDSRIAERREDQARVQVERGVTLDSCRQWTDGVLDDWRCISLKRLRGESEQGRRMQ